MSKKILILDDDVDFNTLLTDVFTQAEYDVISAHDPHKALRLIQEEPVDVIVTDQRMPNLSGVEFFREIRSIHENLPIIMVSGYLDSDTTRDLINNGVSGIFLKPLNIFSLLKRTAELLEDSNTNTKGSSNEYIVSETEGPEYNNTLGFAFKSFPCKAAQSAGFAKKLYSLRNFKSNLLIVGEKGAPFESICEDIRGFAKDVKEELTFLKGNKFDETEILKIYNARTPENVERITTVILETANLEESDIELIFKIAKKEKPFDEIEAPIRFIFCMQDELDKLYDDGCINEDFYIFLGTSEVIIPCLRDCREDISLLAQSIIYDSAKKNDSNVILNIDPKGIEFLESREWPGNFTELKKTIIAAINYTDSLIISHDDLCLACELKDEKSKVKFSELESYLREARDEYAQAVVRLCHGDINKAAKTLGVDPEKIEAFIKTHKMDNHS